MKKLLFIAAIISSGCASQDAIIYSNMAPCDLKIFNSWEQAPEQYKAIGQTSFRDNMINIRCSEKIIMQRFVNQACQVGADGLVLYDVITPGQGSFFGSSTCWQASASFIQFE